ncbi:MAG: hypothetical protein LUD72_01795 [Bacteroidales bacterium]|nr:hypothetical protein [Bacteroidales bacterium]
MEQTIIESESAERNEFRDTVLTLQYDDPNTEEYYVYCVLTSLDGTRISEVYEMGAKVQEISSTSDFDSMLSNNNSSTIYLLTQDIDYSNKDVEGSGTFKGLLNGMGHTIKNITTEKRAVFERVDGGTIENIKFENISINYSGASSSGTSTSAGLIGYMTGGYLYNIAATNLTVVSNGQRVGGIVGQVNVSSGGNTLSTYIDFVSLVNTYTHQPYTTDADGKIEDNYYSGAVISGSERVGGIVGFIQAGGTDSWNKVYISNCYVNAFITSSGGVAGGIVGRSDDRNANDVLVVDSCYVYSLVESTSSGKSYLGGIIGQFTGTGYTCITKCMSYGWLWFGNENISGSLKNASLIVGNFAANGNIEVTKCYARFAEYNEEYGVSSSSIVTNRLSSWQTYTPIEMEAEDGTVYWEFVANDAGVAQAPYLQLVFQGDWETEIGSGEDT